MRGNDPPGDGGSGENPDTSSETPTQDWFEKAKPLSGGDWDRGEGSIPRGTLVDHYRILKGIGHGGMGVVYLARDTNLGRRVALKVLHPNVLVSAEAVQRFLLEARVTARFNHPHIVTIHGVGTFNDAPYLALEYLRGQTLRERLARERPGVIETLRIGRSIADALCEAHRHRVLHRDLKPDNVMLPRDGRLRVLDFGLAKGVQGPTFADRLTPDPAGQSITDSGGDLQLDGSHSMLSVEGLCGTPAYMAPEQWRHEEATDAVDVWALGVILFEMLVGRHPYGTTVPAVLPQLVCTADRAPELPTSVPAAVRELVAGCLEKEPEVRPRPRELVAVFDELITRDRPRGEADMPPFRGLLPFLERHAGTFFGRDEAIAEFLERLRIEPVLPIVGPSGAGKSSFVQAGVVPRLRENSQWLVLRLRPGSQPFEALATRLETRWDDTARISMLTGADLLGEEFSDESDEPSSDDEADRHLAAELLDAPARLGLWLTQLAERHQSRVLLFVDQLEELYTLVDDEAVRLAFMEAICLAADDPEGPVRTLFTLRDDFLGRLAESPPARQALRQVTVLQSPGARALREILVRSVEVSGYHYDDPAMVDEMVNSVQGEPAALPLVQVAGEMLWRRRDRHLRQLCRQAFTELGGVPGALAQHADGVLAGLSGEEEQLARELLLRLVTPDNTRRVVPEDELLGGLVPVAKEVLSRLIAGRLILVRRSRRGASQPMEIELVHESLIQRWTRLRRWLDEGREELVLLAEVGQAAELWHQRGRRDDEVWQGDALHDALRRIGSTAALPDTVRAFLEAGRRKERRQTRRIQRLWMAGIGALVAVALALAGLALEARDQGRQAEHRRQEAELKTAEIRRDAVRLALSQGDTLDARIKLRTLLESEDTVMARALWWLVERNPVRWSRTMPGGMVGAMAFSPDSRTLAVSGWVVACFDTRTSQMRVLRGHRDFGGMLSFSPHGRFVSFGGRAYDVDSGALRVLPQFRTGWVSQEAFSPDGSLLASMGADAVQVWDVADQEIRCTLDDTFGRYELMAFAPDRSVIATTSGDHTIRLWDAVTCAQLDPLVGHEGRITTLRFDETGGRIYTAAEDRTVRSWQLASGTDRILWETRSPVRDLALQTDGPLVAMVLDDNTAEIHTPGDVAPVVFQLPGQDTDRILFALDGQLVVTQKINETVNVWNAETGASVLAVEGNIMTVSPDGQLLAVGPGHPEHIIRLIELSALLKMSEPRGHTSSTLGVDFSPGGEQVISASYDNTMRIWDTATGRQRTVLHQPHAYDGVSMSPDGGILAAGTYDSAVELWDRVHGGLIGDLEGSEQAVTRVRFHPLGRHIAAANKSPDVLLWDLADRAAPTRLRGHRDRVRSVSFSGDGNLLASTSRDGTIRLWDVTSGQTARILSGHEGQVWSAEFGPEGRRLVSGGADETVRLWDLERGTNEIVGRHEGRILGVAFHPDGRRVASASADRTARLWDLSGGGSVVLRGHAGEVNRAVFSRDGRWLATTADDCTLRLWDARTGLPHWRAPILLGDPPAILTHGGWQRLDGEGPPPSPSFWLEAIEQRALMAAVSADGTRGCLWDSTTLELWDLDDDQSISGVPVPSLDRLWVVGERCLTRDREGQLQYHAADGETHTMLDSTTAVTLDGEEILAAVAGEIRVLAGDGSTRASYPAASHVSALARWNSRLILGFKEGSLEWGPAEDPSAAGHGHRFETISYQPVVRLVHGPGNTLIAGFADGAVGLFSLEDGSALAEFKLHGPAVHILERQQTLYVATALGDHEVIDLSIFARDYCSVLKDVWEHIPVAWEQGEAVIDPPPPDHACIGYPESVR